MTSLQGKVVFITGGARGIGAEVARRLRNKGARLVLTDLDKAELAALVTELGEDRALTAVADVRDLAAMQTVADQAVERFGGIDVVVANAGIALTDRCCRSTRRRSSGCWTSTCSVSFTPCVPPCRPSSIVAATC
jgi:NAD(P)-dependent dehydrogenase (short-subunit alcohol dehydrogenase family)